jgi:hypothetical protein
VTGNASTVQGLATTDAADMTGVKESLAGKVESSGGVETTEKDYATAAGNHFDLPHVASTAVDVLAKLEGTLTLLKEPSTTEAKLNDAAGVLDKGAEFVKAALVAAGLTGTATALIPGLGAIAAAARIAQNVAVITRSNAGLIRQKHSLEAFRMQLKGLPESADQKPTRDLLNIKIATTQRMISATTQVWRKSAAMAVADGALVAGNLAGPLAPVGLGLGVAATLVTEAVDSMTNWYLSDQSATLGVKVQQATTKAKAAPDDAALKDAQMKAELELYKVDTYSALVALLEATFSGLSPDAGSPDTDGLLVLRSLGVSSSYLNKCEQLKRSGGNIDYSEAVDAASETIALEKDPMKIAARVASWQTTAKNTALAIPKKIVGGALAATAMLMDTSQPPQAESLRKDQGAFTKMLADNLGPVAAYVKKKDAQGDNGVKPERVQEYTQAAVTTMWAMLDKSLSVPGALKAPRNDYEKDFHRQFQQALNTLLPLMLMGAETRHPVSKKLVVLKPEAVHAPYVNRRVVAIRLWPAGT